MQEFVIPHANEKALFIEQVVINKKSASAFFRQNNIWHRNKNNILQAHFFNPETQELKGITLWQVDPSMRPLFRIDAESGKPTKDGWILSKVVSRKFEQNSQIEKNVLDSMTINLSLDVADLRVIEKSAEDMGVISLWDYIKNLRKSGYDTTRYQALLHSKLSMPFAALIMAFLGIPFALKSNRSGGMGVGIAFSIGIGFSYFIINSLLLSLGEAGAIYPMIAAWASNFIFTAAGLWFSLTVEG
jgi:lipopolysaccharide export system permease protein